MTLDALIIFSGALVAVLPFLGFPNSWDAAFFLVLGVFIVALGIAVRRKGARLDAPRQVRDPHFVDTTPATRAEGYEKEKNEVE
jgi:type IV secretory pathway TrbD component